MVVHLTKEATEEVHPVEDHLLATAEVGHLLAIEILPEMAGEGALVHKVVEEAQDNLSLITFFTKVFYALRRIEHF